MAAEISAGVLAWRRTAAGDVEFLLVHPGGPFWAKKDEAAWSIPKGLVEAGEADWDAARREFAEEVGQAVDGEGQPLTPCKTAAGKTVIAFLVQADLDVNLVRSNSFQMEWPPRSGRMASFPEVDRAQWFDPKTALWKVHKGQRPILSEAISQLKA
ncbi:NUDIX domain-containing protein [Phenylobacterium sp.]|jgi:predicted NUDIX family NTP pyrophosphohydrolase|uniref:NUDIX domain-containing protein n=1 Tax=Phenylobacterium sp. TaxID=1871053 RepID=UPI002F3E9D43